MRKIGEVLTELESAQRVTAAGDARPAASDECPLCKGAGWLRSDVPLGHPLFGRPVMCECLSAKREEREFEDLLTFSNLDPFQHQTFENFDQKVPGVDAAFQAARKFARDPDGWLVLHGAYGCGKTHLAAAIANECISRRFRTLFVVVPELLDHLRSTFAPSSEISYDELFERVRNVPLLVLDDLGTESSTPWAREKLYQILNHRYNLRLPTVVTINEREFDMVDERIKSRMTDRALSEQMAIKSSSYREKQRGQRRLRTSRQA